MPKKKDAIQETDVSVDQETQMELEEETELTDEEKKALEKQGRERTILTKLNAIEEIAAKADEEREQRDGPTKTTDEVEDLQNREEEEEQEEGEPAVKEPEDEIIELKVLGEVRKYPKSQVEEHGGIKAFQKELAADRKLEEAHRREQELERRERELLEKAEKQPSKQTEKETKDADDKSPEKEEAEIDFAALVEKIQFGEPDEATEAFKTTMEMLQKGRGGATTREEMLSVIREAKAEEERERKDAERQSIVDRFNAPVDKGGFADIKASPYLMDAVATLIDEKLASGEDNSWETYEAAGKEIRKRREEALNPKPKKTTVTGFEEKKELKKGKDTITGANVRQQPSTSTEGTKSEEEARSEALTDIMKARGQKP